MAECYFKAMSRCTEPCNQILSKAGTARMKSIIAASKARGDKLPTDLEQCIEADKTATILCHRSCVSTYTSKHKIKCSQKNLDDSLSEPCQTKRTRHSLSRSDFNFQTHCIFCGEKCIEERDSKNPSRWRAVSRCRTIDSKSGDKNFKETILQVCHERQDQWGKDVELRVLGAISDLHAADARYHRDCRPSFMGLNSIKSCGTVDSKSEKEPAFVELIKYLHTHKESNMWSSTEIYKYYIERNGTKFHKRALIDALSKHFDGQLLLLSCNGLATILVFKTHASKLVQLVEEPDDDMFAVKSVAKQIIKESKAIEVDSESYNTRINKGIAQAESSTTLLYLLSQISPNLCDSLTALLIGNMVTYAVIHKPTALQISLGISAREKHMINTLYNFSVTCSYDEVLRFKSSAAHKSAENSNTMGLFDAKNGLIQTVIDNYDANISSLNGLKSTHALAMLMCQSVTNSTAIDDSEEQNIERLKKANTKLPVDDFTIHHYSGSKHPDMLISPLMSTEDQTQLEQCQKVSLRRAQQLDLQFLKSVSSSENIPEYGGHITKVAREQHHTVRPATVTYYRPLIDLKPSDPSTIKTALIEAQSLTSDCGQAFVVITADQQLYKVILDNIWSSPELFGNIYPRLGGLHTMMSFCGSVGKLMMSSGLSDILKYAFGGVEKMLSGKKYPQNFRAFRMLTEIILEKHISETDSVESLFRMLTEASDKSKTSKLWVDCFIRPVLIMMAFTRAERESDWPLHLWAMSEMLPYFFASGHINYARYGLYYLRSMEALPSEIKHMFLKGQHTMRHSPGASNSTWSDMYIETTFMRFGHSQGGLTGITLNSNATRRWALSLHSCSVLARDIQAMMDNIQQPSIYHKEESPARIRTDSLDRHKLKEKLKHCIDPLDPAGHNKQLFHIVTGKIAGMSANVDNAFTLGKESMNEYERKLPGGFYQPIGCPVITMASKQKQEMCGTTKQMFDTELIFTRSLGLMDTEDFKLNELFGFELSQIPTSLFTDEGDLRPATSKSKLKNFLSVEQSIRMTPTPDIIVLDGCAILWTIHWPISGNVSDLIKVVEIYLRQKLANSDVYLVFDRYYEYSTKGCTRCKRSSVTDTGPFHFTVNSLLPSQTACMSIIDNKVQIIALLCNSLIEHFQTDPTERELVITGPDPQPHSIKNGNHIRKLNLSVMHEEADIIIANHVVHISKQTQKTIHVICDDTDVFALLIHFYACEHLCNKLFMVPTHASQNVINIGATAKKHSDIMRFVLPLHALTGCDTVSTIYGIGKVKALKSLKGGTCPPLLGDISQSDDELENQAITFIAKCYGSKVKDNMTNVRFSVWQHKTARGKSRHFKLATLPPTSKAFHLHFKRAQYQVHLWNAALETNPPILDATDFGWIKDLENHILVPVMLPPNTLVAPERVLNLLCCKCSAIESCSTRRCSCLKNDLACSVFCNCNTADIASSSHCFNPLNKTFAEAEDSEDELNEDEDELAG